MCLYCVQCAYFIYYRGSTSWQMFNKLRLILSAVTAFVLFFFAHFPLFLHNIRVLLCNLPETIAENFNSFTTDLHSKHIQHRSHILNVPALYEKNDVVDGKSFKLNLFGFYFLTRLYCILCACECVDRCTYHPCFPHKNN